VSQVRGSAPSSGVPTDVTALHSIATDGSTTANAVGGAGLPTGAHTIQ
jgi:hypothetical protein